MEIIVGSKHLATQVFTAHDVTGREHLVIIAKATWQIPAAGQRPRPLPPEPIAVADSYFGEPGLSPMRYGSDCVRFKLRCDILLDAIAYPPQYQPQTEWRAGFRVGNLQKALRVLGPRQWQKRFGSYAISDPAATASVPLHYGYAFGGSHEYTVQQDGQAISYTEALLSNPVGMGWRGSQSGAELSGQPAPQLESIHAAIQAPDDNLAPMALSAIGRHWLPRTQYTGTYDERWQQEVFPFLPEDFDERFNQCAPMDQQTDYLLGGEEIVLLNLHPSQPDIRFKLPPLDGITPKVLRNDYSSEMPACHADTLYIEPEQNRFSIVWRASTPIRRRLQEFKTIAIGPVNPQWWKEQTLGMEGGCSGCGSSPLVIADITDEDE